MEKDAAKAVEEMKSANTFEMIERWDGDIPPYPVECLEGRKNLPSNIGDDFLMKLKEKNEERDEERLSLGIPPFI